jgi:uncharacterized protein
MDITPLINIDQQYIQGYGEGRFRISGTVYEHPVIVMPSGTVEWRVTSGVSGLTLDDFKLLIDKADELDVVLLGSGAKGERPSSELRRALKDKGLNIECMDSGAACRTYNVLMAEGRRVGAALLAV